MAAAVIFVHEVHEVVAGRMTEFADAVRTGWRRLLEADGTAQLLWFWELTHGTGASYQALTLTAVADWAAWGRLVGRMTGAGPLHEWQRAASALRKDVTARILLPVPWSPLDDVDLASPPPEHDVDAPALYLHDTGWPFPGKLDGYVDALEKVYLPQIRRSRMISVVGCWTVAPGTGRQHEVVLLQRIEDWAQFSRLLTAGEQAHQRTGWMEEGLRWRDRWESKLLRCARWSPRQ